MYPKRVSRVRISLSPQRYDTQPAAIAAGCFRHTADTSSLVDDVWRKQTRGPSGPTAVGHRFARTPREGTEIATAPGRRNLALHSVSAFTHNHPHTPLQTLTRQGKRAKSPKILPPQHTECPATRFFCKHVWHCLPPLEDNTSFPYKIWSLSGFND